VADVELSPAERRAGKSAIHCRFRAVPQVEEDRPGGQGVKVESVFPEKGCEGTSDPFSGDGFFFPLPDPAAFLPPLPGAESSRHREHFAEEVWGNFPQSYRRRTA
jgi:hypothetical protein